MHVPVLLQESINGLNLRNGSIIVDGTLGLGGHAKEIVQKIIPKGLLIGIDQDPRNLVLAKKNLQDFEKNILFVQTNFDQVEKILKEHSIEKVDGIFLDLGISSPHLDEAERGFSFQADGPLDMRMNPEQTLTAATIVNTYSAHDIARILREYGEEPQAWKIAQAIVEERKNKPITTTQEFTMIIEKVSKNKKQKKHPALLTFQALRIAVNDELGALRRTLEATVGLLNPGGRLVVISYHSLEDRIVKHFFREQTRHCICPKEFPLCICKARPQLKIITKDPILPSEQEVCTNSRSRSAKLRIAERTENEYINFDTEEERVLKGGFSYHLTEKH